MIKSLEILKNLKRSIKDSFLKIALFLLFKGTYETIMNEQLFLSFSIITRMTNYL